MTEINYDTKGRPQVKFCPLCGVQDPGGIWGGEEHAAIGSCRGCGKNVIIDIGPASMSPVFNVKLSPHAGQVAGPFATRDEAEAVMKERQEDTYSDLYVEKSNA